MTHYYYYLIKNLCEREVIVYNVKVGNQKRHNTLLNKLLDLCRREDCYINIRNSQSTEFVRNLMSNYNVTAHTVLIIDMYKCAYQAAEINPKQTIINLLISNNLQHIYIL